MITERALRFALRIRAKRYCTTGMIIQEMIPCMSFKAKKAEGKSILMAFPLFLQRILDDKHSLL